VETAMPEKPAFVAHPRGSPVYHGFVVVPETYIDGWVLGEITEYIGNEDGDGFVVAPDGSRAGLVWEVGEGEVQRILPPDKERWGVYAIWFPHKMRAMADLIGNFRSVLPLLKQLHSKVHS
jgi:hypothetical protein